MRHAHDGKANHSLAVLRVNRAVPEDVIDGIRREIKPLTAVSVTL